MEPGSAAVAVSGALAKAVVKAAARAGQDRETFLQELMVRNPTNETEKLLQSWMKQRQGIEQTRERVATKDQEAAGLRHRLEESKVKIPRLEASWRAQAGTREGEAMRSELMERRTQLPLIERGIVSVNDALHQLHNQLQKEERSLHDWTLEKLYEPSAESFVKHLVGANAAIAALTAASTGVLLTFCSRDPALADAALPAFLVGLTGLAFGLSFHVPPLLVHFRDWHKASYGRLNAQQEPAGTAHRSRIQTAQIAIVGMQLLVWLGLVALTVYVLAVFSPTPVTGL